MRKSMLVRNYIIIALWDEKINATEKLHIYPYKGVIITLSEERK
jgi:hypothetical protein